MLEVFVPRDFMFIDSDLDDIVAYAIFSKKHPEFTSWEQAENALENAIYNGWLPDGNYQIEGFKCANINNIDFGDLLEID